MGKLETATKEASRDEYARERAVTEADYVFGDEGDDCFNANLLEGEERRKALEMAGLKDDVGEISAQAGEADATDEAVGIRRPRKTLDAKRRQGKWYGDSMPSIEVNGKMEGNEWVEGIKEEGNLSDSAGKY